MATGYLLLHPSHDRREEEVRKERIVCKERIKRIYRAYRFTKIRKQGIDDKIDGESKLVTSQQPQ
jgi:hypothetical protein